MKIKKITEVDDTLPWSDITHVNVGSSYTQSTLSISVGGRKWYGIELEDESLKTDLPLDIIEGLKLYESMSAELMWSELVYHADDNPHMKDSDLAGHFYRCVGYIEKVLVSKIQRLNPEKVVTNRRDIH